MNTGGSGGPVVSVVLLKRRRMEFNYRGDLNTKLVQFSYGKSVTYIDANPVNFVFIWVPITGIRW